MVLSPNDILVPRAGRLLSLLVVAAMTAVRNAAVNEASLASIGDPDGTRTVTSIVALLVPIGLALLLVAVWMYRATRTDPDLLAPLEVMGVRKWRRGDPVWQRRRLDELRPAGARPLEPSVAPPAFDASFDEPVVMLAI